MASSAAVSTGRNDLYWEEQPKIWGDIYFLYSYPNR